MDENSPRSWSYPYRPSHRTHRKNDRASAQVLERGVPEDEPEFVAAVKAANPKIAPSELKEVIKQFRDVVSERQQRDLGRR